MNELNFYNALSSDLNALLNQTKNVQSNSIFDSNSDSGDHES